MSVYSGFIRPVYALDFYPTLTLMTFDDDGLLSAYGEVQYDPNGDDKYFVNVYRWNGNRYELQGYGSSSSWQDCADLYAGNEDLNYFGWDVFIPTGLDRRVTVDDEELLAYEACCALDMPLQEYMKGFNPFEREVSR